MSYLKEEVEARTLFTVLTRSYVIVAGTLVVLSFFTSTDDEAGFDGSTAVAHYNSGTLWQMAAEGTNLGIFGVLLTLALVVCTIVAAFRRLVPRRPGLDLAIAVLAALFVLLLVTKPDYLDDAEPDLLFAGQVYVAVLTATAALGVVMEALAWSPGRRS